MRGHHHHRVSQALADDSGTGLLVILMEDNRFRAEITGEHGIAQPITYHITAFKVIVTVHIRGEHPGAWLAGRGIILRKCAVNEYVVKYHTLIGKRLKHLIMRRIKCILRK